MNHSTRLILFSTRSYDDDQSGEEWDNNKSRQKVAEKSQTECEMPKQIGEEIK